ncbi:MULTISPECIES: GrdX family protein [Psychrilyobacter]|nr:MULTISPECIES: GrdX family protein [Psychrilyobacter]MCS5422572.1 GrdX family protein [Psychrilyobacter sp. S5]
MGYLIVSNNPMVKEKFDNVYFIEGTSREVLEKVRDLVHEGFELMTHPLGASLRMMFSPCFSVVVKEKQGEFNYFHTEIIESSIEKYNQHMEVREEDVENSKDYAVVDYKLLESALGEINNNAMSF